MINRATVAGLAPQPNSPIAQSSQDVPAGSLTWAKATGANLSTAHSMVDALLIAVGGIGGDYAAQGCTPPRLGEPSLNFVLGENTDESANLVEKLQALTALLAA